MSWAWSLPAVAVAVVIIIVLFETLNWLLAPKRISLKGRSVLIVGGSSGIGLCMAELAVKEGAHLAIAARNKDRLEEALKQLEAHAHVPPVGTPPSARLLSLVCDASDPSSAAAAVAAVAAAFGGLDVLVCCQGVCLPHAFENDTLENQRRMMDINFWGTVHVVRAALPFVKRAGSEGRIMMVSSQAGQVGIYGYTAYAASKFALRGFAESLQMELEHVGTRVGLLFPPDTDTPQLAQESETKPEVTKYISGRSSPFPPQQVARRAISAVHSGAFISTVGLDGWMLSIAAAGMSPQPSLRRLLGEVLLASLMRVVAAVTLSGFNGAARRWHRINYGRGGPLLKRSLR